MNFTKKKKKEKTKMTNELKELEDKATEIFLAKSSWKDRYNNAPDAAKAYYRLMFASSLLAMASKDGEEDESALKLTEETNAVYHGLDDASWEYLMKNAGHAEAQGLYITRRHMQGNPSVNYGDWLK